MHLSFENSKGPPFLQKKQCLTTLNSKWPLRPFKKTSGSQYFILNETKKLTKTAEKYDISESKTDFLKKRLSWGVPPGQL